MKVVYIISVYGHGRGGHFHSLNHIANAMGDELEVEIYSIGIRPSEIIKSNKWYKEHLNFNGYNLLSLRKDMKRVFSKKDIDIFHCFDVNAYNMFTLLMNEKNVVLNKCGGPNPIKYPFVQNLVLFSKENKLWFEENEKFKDSKIKLIPNRVSLGQLSVKLRKDIVKNSKFCFVRIARIGETYLKSFEDSIRLIENLELSRPGMVCLYIIGTIENEVVYKTLKNKAKGLPIEFLTADNYTKKASDMLYLADAVIGTGRGVMEGTGLALPLLIPAKNSDIPVLLNDESFESFLMSNFSERSVVPSGCVKNNMDKIDSLVVDNNFYQK